MNNSRLSLRLAGCLMIMLLSSCTSGNSVADAPAHPLPALTPEQAAWVADMIYGNECNRQPRCLTSWNIGEDFPSLGIGHFIWYREGQQERFVESFPALLGFYVAQGVSLPAWLSGLPGWDAPWDTREQFLAEVDGPRLTQLREFLLDTRGVQAQFIIERLHQSLPAIAAASEHPQEISALFYQLAHASLPQGMYALIDYVNFKGEGTAPGERYQGEGWGLLQVLEQMRQDRADASLHGQASVLDAFAQAARTVLARRIANAPPERGEERWRQGWNNRTSTYQQADTQ